MNMPEFFSDPTPTFQPPAPVEQPSSTQLATAVQPVSGDQHRLGVFTTFCPNPNNVSFAAQEAGEQILLFLRRDFITNVPWIFSTIVLLFVPPLLFFIFRTLQFSLFAFPQGFIVVFITFYYILVVGFALANFISWFYNIGLVTSKRVVDLDFYDISTINLATAIFTDIKDAEFTQAGFFQSFFDYGDVRMRLEASTETFIFDKVPRPEEVVKILSNLVGGN